MDVRRIRADEGAVLRAVRLRMLADSPDAYLTTLAEAEAHPVEVFHERARTQADGSDRASFLAFDGAEAVGSVTGVEGDDGGRQLVAMWVDPEHRRSGVGRRLVEALLQWAWASSAERVTLWVVDSNDSARQLYRSFGFRPTGARQPLRHRPDLVEVELELRRPQGDSIPAHYVLVRTTPVFHQDSVPAGLLRAHQIAADVWGRLVVETGSLGFTFEDEPDRPLELATGGVQVIPPQRPHHLTIDGPVSFVVEFYRPG